ncbi:hypothetical protein Q428_06745 [Fervidicella metallireducens AeB]|uniref:YkuS family protein n=1 Tax=Fervidicella metallireducens AeB TaxID=1403537 RepID=A0A017RWA6_9CLOT|nr:YkuS family protein [Fervidicella metallireducens]EYE88679.1 hypothetical protein Q428_06745 [Fervidicella metallireducens AeB]
MIISCDHKLADVKQFLINKGYEVYDIEENVPSNVYIYSENKRGLFNLYNSIKATEDGSFIINADGKDYEEIEYEINHKLYSPLF